MENNMKIKGFKVFNAEWVCRDKEYTCPGRFKEDGELEVCGHGMHFCLNAADCFRYYSFDPNNHVAEVIAHGKVVYGDDKCCTDDLEIVREVPWDEVLRIINTGKNCTGFCNTGDWNTGNKNTGDGNTGDWNKSSFNTGCFMTEEPNISLFNKPSDWSRMDWWNSKARRLLNQIPKNVVEWIYSEDMTDEEKAENPTYETTGGYLKVLDESKCAQSWWDKLPESNRQIIKDLPNFDAGIFEQCTGIKVDD